MKLDLLKNFPLEHRLEVFLPQLIALEQASYDVTEAASPASLALRVTKCAEWFVVMFDNEQVIKGFACGTLGRSNLIVSGDAMTTHHEDGTRLFLHSVVVDAQLRGNGFGLQLVHEFVKAARMTPQVEAVALVAKAKGIALYNRAGFTFMGDSPLRHGPERWYAMELGLKHVGVVCVDAFSSKPFAGNSAAVVVLPDPVYETTENKDSVKRVKQAAGKDDILGLLAREFNVAETAFVTFTQPEGAGFASTLSPLERVIALAESSVAVHSMFNETLGTIKKHFKFNPDAKFRVGDVISLQNQNVGSLCVLAVARALNLSKSTTARLWCEHYRNVVEHPEETTSHPNIRSFLNGGEVVFEDAKGKAINTPIIDFDVEALALIVAKNPSFLSTDPNCASIASITAQDSIRFEEPSKRHLDVFRDFFVMDHEPTKIFDKIRSVSRPMLAILLRANIIDVPEPIIVQSLQNTTREDFAKEYSLDDYSRKRLGVYETSPNRRIAKCSLRWFTPARVEVDLCGHATLAAAQALFEELGPLAKRRDFHEIHFSTRSGVLIARNSGHGRIELDFPIQTFEILGESEIASLPVFESFPSLRKQDVEILASTSTNTYMLVVTNEAFHSRLDKIVLEKIRLFEKRGVCVTCRESTDGVHFSSRMFAPQIGIDEDPVTGSTHCFLAAYWGGLLNTNKVVGHQRSERGGFVECEIIRDRVMLRGTATLAWRGQVVFPALSEE